MAPLRTLLFGSVLVAFCTYVAAAKIKCYKCDGPFPDGACGKKFQNASLTETSDNGRCYFGIQTTKKDNKKTFIRGPVEGIQKPDQDVMVQLTLCEKELCNGEKINGAFSAKPFALATICSMVVSLLFCKSF